MRRRTFLQALLALPALALPKVAQQPQTTDQGIRYTDSEGRTHAQLAPLYDGERKEGGIEYLP